MEIELIALSKRYGYQWIIKDVNFIFNSNEITGIGGRNGSGKSTLIKLIAGFLSPSSGKIIYKSENKTILPPQFYQYFTWVAPYTDLIQEYNLEEMFAFHCKFNHYSQLTFKQFVEILDWQNPGEKQLRHFSSGMKQKVQLALSLLTNKPIVLLDEPTSYLDEQAKKWFADLLGKVKENKTVIISSNDSFDLNLCHSIQDVSLMK